MHLEWNVRALATLAFSVTGAVLLGQGPVGPAGGASAGPSPASELHVQVEAAGVRADGGAGGGPGFSVVAADLGQTRERSLSIMSHGCGGASAPYIVDEAVAGWHLWVTPVAVEGDAVTFRILWERSPNGNADAWNPGVEQTFTLRPGEFVPLDVISNPPRSASRDGGCLATSLRVSVITSPRPEDDRRLISADLSLVERRPGGSTRDQRMVLRGLFHREMPFFFDTIEDRGVLLEFQGEMAARPDADGVVLTLTVRSRVVSDGRVVTFLREGAMMRSREVTSVLRLAPGAAAVIELPRLEENDSGGFEGSTFSIHVASRQVR